MHQENLQKEYQIDLVWLFHTMKWLKNGMDLQFIITEFEAKHPQLEPLPIVQDPQSLENARPQIAVSRVFVGG